MPNKKVLQNLDFGLSSRVLNLPRVPSGVDDAISQQGVFDVVAKSNWKAACRLATTEDLDLLSPGSTIAGKTMVVGDRILVKDQVDFSENGIYEWKGPTTPLVRTFDANSAEELYEALVLIEGGAQKGAIWRQTQWGGANQDILWEIYIDPNTTPQKYIVTFGNATDLSYTITHNLGSKDVVTSIYEVSTGGEVFADVVRATNNTLTVSFSVAPGDNAYRIVVIS